MPFQHTQTTLGHVGPKPTDVSIRISNARRVRAECHNNPEFWLEFTLPAVLPASVRAEGSVGKAHACITVSMDASRHAVAHCAGNPEFWLNFFVPLPGAKEWDE